MKSQKCTAGKKQNPCCKERIVELLGLFSFYATWGFWYEVAWPAQTWDRKMNYINTWREANFEKQMIKTNWRLHQFENWMKHHGSLKIMNTPSF